MNTHWWKDKVVYQIYPKSFRDSNGDGIGDLQGITSRLDYLKELGIGAIWLCPVFCSPQDDNGYDISNYKDIDPMFGTLADMDELIAEARERGIVIMMDLVLNHSSDEHPWFIEACKNRENPYHDYYVWHDGLPRTKSPLQGSDASAIPEPPNDLKSAFGGSAWTWVPEVGQYYFHQFSVKQPDLNWHNPKVREELYEAINFWRDRGIGGFRLDVIELVGKEPEKGITVNGPKLHRYLQEMSAACFRGHELITVGECWGATPELAKLYSNPDGSEFSMVFQFEHIVLDQKGEEKWDLAPLDLIELKKVLAKWQGSLDGQGWNSLFWDNHDLPRIVSRFGDDGKYRVESAKMLAILLHGMQGTPYVYQGEELGMTNVRMLIEDYRDLESLNMRQERLAAGYSEEEIMASIYAKGRDNARTPMQWDTAAYAGFTHGAQEPWIPVNPNYKEINAADQLADPDSIFHCYRRLIALRKEEPLLTEGSFRLLYPEDPDLFVYKRISEEGELLVLANFHGENMDVPDDLELDGELILSSYGDVMESRHLRPYEARMYRSLRG